MNFFAKISKVLKAILPFIKHGKTARDVAVAADALDAVVKDDADKKTEQR